MTGTIADPARMQELRDELEKMGIILPDDVDDESFERSLLCACKTAAATRRVFAAEQAAKRQGGNPDSPDDDAGYAMTHQFSTEGGRRRRSVPRLDDAAVAKKIIDRQERYLANPNFARPAY